jgi:hypothetical protein
MPLKPWPPEVIVRRLKWTSMSSQCAKLSVIARYVSGSAARRLPSVWSEKTTPQPKVSSGRLRSSTVTWWRGIGLLEQEGEVQPRRPPADDHHLQGLPIRHVRATRCWLRVTSGSEATDRDARGKGDGRTSSSGFGMLPPPCIGRMNRGAPTPHPGLNPRQQRHQVRLRGLPRRHRRHPRTVAAGQTGSSRLRCVAAQSAQADCALSLRRFQPPGAGPEIATASPSRTAPPRSTTARRPPRSSRSRITPR